MGQEIIPPSSRRSQELDIMDRALARIPEYPMRVLPGSPVPSGHWWVSIEGEGEATLTVNDHQIIFKRGEWYVINNKHFQAALETDWPMSWFEGKFVWEKAWQMRGPYKVMVPRLVQIPIDDLALEAHR